jgi:hypothetical protein
MKRGHFSFVNALRDERPHGAALRGCEARHDQKQQARQ